MNALVSGQAGLAVLIDGSRISSFALDSSDEPLPRAESDIPYLFAEATDVVEFDDVTHDRALEELERSWRKDRVLRLMLVLLDGQADADTRRMAVECLEEFLPEAEVFDSVANPLFAKPLPGGADPDGAIRHAHGVGASRVVTFLSDLEAHQPDIAMKREAWDALPIDRFGGVDARRLFEYEVVSSGLFRRLVEAREDAKRIDMALMSGLANPRLQPLANHRQVILEWVEPFKTAAASPRRPQPLADDQAIDAELGGPTPYGGAGRLRGVYERASKQKEQIVRLLAKGDREKAFEYTDDLVGFHETYSKREHAAKSLCDLAQKAKELWDHDSQLEFARRAVDILPSDGWAQAQLGDAYLCVGRHEEALNAYESAVSLGQPEVGRNGRAEVLKSLGRFDDALGQYDEAISLFPYDEVGRNGKASTLVLMGRYSDARDSLPTEEPRTEQDWIALHIRGMIALKQRDLVSAIAVFQQGTQWCPWWSSAPYFKGALALAWLHQGKLRQAAAEVANVDQPVGRVLCLHAYGRLSETRKAESAFNQIKDNTLPALAAVRDELAAQFGFLSRTGEAKSDEWVFQKECDLLLVA